LATFDDWSTVADSNTTTSGVNIAEGCPAANVNNWGRSIMAQLRAAFNPILSTFFASTTLAQARSALGVTEGGASQNNFSALTNTANSVPYMTGSDAWALATVTSFARTLLDDGDAATMRTTLGVVASSLTATTNGNGTSLGLVISGTTYQIQFGTVTVAGATTAAITFPVAFSGTPVVICSGGSTNTGSSANDRITAISSSGATITSDYGTSHTSKWIALGS
jgi:hypothetical protein